MRKMLPLLLTLILLMLSSTTAATGEDATSSATISADAGLATDGVLKTLGKERIFTRSGPDTDFRDTGTYTVAGEPVEPPALHPLAITATTAAASLATDTPLSLAWARKFWDSPMRRGDRRYYDNCLYFFCLLMLGGRYRMLA